jgi:transposase
MMMDIDIRDASEACESSTHTSTRMSAHKQRIEVITRGERRRRWSAEEKQAIVTESLAPNVSIAGIARKHGIGTGQLYGWRHQFLVNRPGTRASFARVELLNEPPHRGEPAQPRCGLIEIVLPNGPTIRVDAQVDEHALRRVLGVLRG